MNARIPALAATALVVGALALAGCAGPGQSRTAAQPGAAPASAAKPAASGQQAPGPYTPNGSIDGSSGTVALAAVGPMKWQPNTITGVKAGQKVTVQLKNSDTLLHSFVAPSLGATAKVDVQPGGSATATFTAPSAPGTYQFWCAEAGHAEAGMVGQVVVQ